MKIRHIFNRYLAIIGKLSNGKKANYEQILAHLTQEFELVDRGIEVEFSKRTFQRAIKDIYELFNIQITCDRNGYYSASIEDQREDMHRLSQNLHLMHFQKHFENFQNHIDYDNSCYQGSEHIYDIQRAIQNRNALVIQHRKYRGDSKPKTRNIAPYGLKEYLGRWYLLALDIEINELRTFGLDRILSISELGRKFTIPENFSIGKYFKSSIGVQVNSSAPEEIVLLRVENKIADYFKTLPLHASQKIEESTSTHTLFRYKLKVNLSLENEIMRFADFIYVERPLHLRQKIKSRLQKALNLLE